MSTMPTPTDTAAQPEPHRGRRRALLALLSLLLVAGLVAGVVLLGDDAVPESAADVTSATPATTSSGAPDDVPTEAGGIAAVAGRLAGLAGAAAVGTPAVDEPVAGAPGAPATTVVPGGSKVPAPGGAGGPAGPPAPGPAVLVVDSDLYPETGATDVIFRIGNAGGSPLHWTIPEQEGHQGASPTAGVVAPGANAMVVFELQGPAIDGDVPLMVTSDGGSRQVTIHFTKLDPVFEIVSGTWNIRNGNTFLPAYGVMDLGLQLKNVGDAPLTVTPIHAGGLDIIGGPWVLAPGQEVHLHVVLCNASFGGGIPDFHDRDLHIQTDGWQGTIDFGVRFTLAPGQVAPACP